MSLSGPPQPALSVDYRSSLLESLSLRDRLERDNYHSYIAAYGALLEQVKNAKGRIFQLEQELLQARQGGVGVNTGQSPSSIPNKSLEEKLSKLQEDLTGAYRQHSEMASTNLRLKEQAEKDEKALVATQFQLEVKSKEVEQIRLDKDKEILSLTQRNRSIEATVELMRSEVQGSRAALAAVENKLKLMEQENAMLVEQLLKTKVEQAQELNAMNDIVATSKQRNSVAITKEEKASAAATAGLGLGINVSVSDLTDANSIIDHVAWQANFNVALPTERKRTVKAHRGQCTAVRYNHNGTLLASCGTDGIIRIYEARGGANRASLRSSNDSIMSCAFSGDENFLIATGNDQTARIWSLKARKVVHTLIGHSSKIYAGSFTMDSATAITGSHDRTIRLWDIEHEGTCSRTILCHSSCNYLSLSSHENYIASAHLDCHLRFWSARSGELMYDAENVHTQQATSVEFSRDGILAVSTSRDNTVQVLDIRTWKVLRSMETSKNKEMYRNLVNWNRAVFSPDGQYIAAGSASGALFIWNTDSGKCVSALLPTAGGNASSGAASGAVTVELNENSLSCVDWNRNGRQLIASDMGGNILFYEP